MMYREVNMLSFEVVFTGFLLFGSIILLHQIVTLNPVDPTSVVIVVSFIVFGLLSGVIAAIMTTQGELRVLSRKGEFTLRNRSVVYAATVGLPVFLFINFFFVLFGSAFVFGEIFFLFAGFFTYFLSRLSLIVRWEKRNKRVVMTRYGTFTASGKLYSYLKPANQIQDANRSSNQIGHESIARAIGWVGHKNGTTTDYYPLMVPVVVVPEFPMIQATMFFMLLTLLAVVIYKRKAVKTSQS